MSFYDLTKDTVLSANDLFKYRLKRDATVPSKGGQKAFEPDGSWIHAKALESFMQERTSILGEQRVEKLKNLVQGVWEQEKRLVNLSKPGKFWAHMGFTDKRRNWLYPEEALFLMETNTLEVYHNGLPLSIQEAYTKFMGPDLSLEEYQVFAHLRRLGFVVLRQEAQLEITPYEKQINLDKYMTKQNLKERKEKQLAKKEKLETDCTDSSFEESKELSSKATQSATETGKEVGQTDEFLDLDIATIASGSQKVSTESMETPTYEGASDKQAKANTSSANAKRSLADEAGLNGECPKKKPKTDSKSDENFKPGNVDDFRDTRWYVNDAWISCFKSSQLHSSENSGSEEVALLEAKKKQDSAKVDRAQIFPFPTIANKALLSLPQPWPQLLPSNVEVNEDYNDILVFDVEDYRIKHPHREESKAVQLEEEREARIRSLKFSFSEWTQRKVHIKASNWNEYKQRARESLTSTSQHTPVDHLWQGAVTPLVRPEDALSKSEWPWYNL
ncbi:tRNA-splicing endonuclease subunit sen54 [Plakobranchus ocellatus]|uniref:tRNA-splicing endonuclease subunit sen54 n=1 Tax=Plakobranchus ocellatus TaxID=259542 RepID=A0AAV4A591_9GAST|nr:tRNA-splicing endonuclease subunit sen54 [Plakobranchus ocellatus]